jgi:DNA primase
MARIPDEELERLKREVSLVRLIEGQGHTLISQGKDLACRCPWHEGDDTPSCVVTPKTNLWHCFGCDAGGTVIDWVMRSHRVSFRHACELLAKEHPALGAAHGTEPAAGKLSPAKLRQAQSFLLDAGDQALLDQVIGYYHATLKTSPEALSYLEGRGLGGAELIERFRLGYANRTLAYRLAPKQYKAGAELRAALQRVGLLRESGHEHFNGSIVVPLFGPADGNTRPVVGAYGRKVNDNLRAGTPKHLYLPGPHRGVFNREGIEGQAEVILCEALLDALTFWAAGYRNVTSCYGVNGFTDEMLATFKACGTQRVLIAFDRDEAGDRVAEALAKRLMSEGLDCYRILFPRGMDANEYACKVGPPQKSLGVAIRSAQWLGKGVRPADAVTTVPLSLAASSLPSAPSSDAIPLPEVPPLPEVTRDELPREALPTDLPIEVREHEILIVLGDRRWRVRGLTDEIAGSLKVNLLIARGERFHVDTLDLYSARSRAVYVAQAVSELGLAEETVKRDLGAVLLKLEALQAERVARPVASPTEKMTLDEKAEALALLRDPRLTDRILEDLTVCGIVGEETNKLVAYLGALSRKLDAPLALVIQSLSGAGKSALMDAVLELMPEEERLHYSAMTGQSLFYLGNQDLRHKILAIAEEAGVREAAYALKLLQSAGELTIASTGKDAVTGKLVTHTYRVEGPVMLFLTTTAIELDEELANRCLVLTVNESREQTRAIQVRQRVAQTLEGLLASETRRHVQQLHRNAQRLLRPLRVVNPFAPALTFLDDRTRTRRDHQKYLTLIRACALLHQYQREIKTVEHRGELIEYIEATAADIALANALAHQVLGQSLDALPPQTRALLKLLYAMVKTLAQERGVREDAIRFTRREAMAHTHWSYEQLRVHLERLAELDYLLVHGGGRGQRIAYELLWRGEGEDGSPFLLGLTEAEAVAAEAVTTMTTLGGERGGFGGPLSPGCGAVGGALDEAERAPNALNPSTSVQDVQSEVESRTSPDRLDASSYRTAASLSSSLAAAASRS